jgi:dihydrodipicolinate synthase/N-acetylneuraminate lyase
MCSTRQLITSEDLARGIIGCTLTPFDQAGGIMRESITDQARRLARISGVIGIAVNTVTRERLTLTPDERLDVIRCTRRGMQNNQLLVSCVGELSEQVVGEMIASGEAGADAIFTILDKGQIGYEDRTSDAHLNALSDLANRIPLPIIIGRGNSGGHRMPSRNEIKMFAQISENVIVFDTSAVHDAQTSDQDCLALESMGRILASPTSFKAAPFDNFNVSDDWGMASLACIAPHEIASLYTATRQGRVHDATASHHRLFPLVQFLSCHEENIREMIHREASTYRGILTSPHARHLDSDLCPDIKSQLHRVIDDSGFKPVSWI